MIEADLLGDFNVSQISRRQQALCNRDALFLQVSIRSYAFETVEQADEVVRENPIPVIFTAIAIGFGLGLLCRSFETDRRSHPIRECLDETSDILTSIFRPIGKRTRRAAQAGSRDRKTF